MSHKSHDREAEMENTRKREQQRNGGKKSSEAGDKIDSEKEAKTAENGDNGTSNIRRHLSLNKLKRTQISSCGGDGSYRHGLLLL